VATLQLADAFARRHGASEEEVEELLCPHSLHRHATSGKADLMDVIDTLLTLATQHSQVSRTRGLPRACGRRLRPVVMSTGYSMELDFSLPAF
jgi:hypothetical protein